VKRLLPVALLVLVGCAAAPPPDTIALNHDLATGACFWHLEAAQHLHNPVVVACHGGDIDGQWTCHPDGAPPMPVLSMVATLRRIYPEPRDIVLIVCNEDGDTLHAAHVYYAKHKVWSMPRYFRFDCDNESDGVGDIRDFVTTP
jgi:hypothetical protein